MNSVVRQSTVVLVVLTVALLLTPLARATTFIEMLSNQSPPRQNITPTAETITVTTTEDLDTSLSATCADNPGDPCTLRRAIVQARESTNKPVTIAFDLPTRYGCSSLVVLAVS